MNISTFWDHHVGLCDCRYNIIVVIYYTPNEDNLIVVSSNHPSS